MSILDQTLPASYKGIPFLVVRAGTTGGIKSVKHVFPNSSNQVIEKLGPKQRSYSVQAIINNDPAVDDYQSKKQALISVLDDGVAGVLIHPLFGHLNNIIAVDWNLDEDFSALGIASFSISFQVDLPQSVPQVASNTLSQVVEFSGSVTKAVTQDFAVDYVVDFFNNVADSIEQANDFITDFSDNIFVFTILTDSVNNINNQVNEFGSNIINLVRQPLELAESVESLFQTTAAMYASVEATFEVITSFFGFGDDDVEFPSDTISRIERNSNRELFRNMIQANALTHAYNLASQISFDTIEDQEEVADTLEAQYDRIVFNSTVTNLKGDNISVGISEQTKALITDQRIAVQKLFDDNRVFLGRIITVYTVPTSARLLAYRYYGDSQLGEDIAQLNGLGGSPSFVEGDLDIITS